MAKPEFIIALTEHRYLGYVFVPYLINPKGQFYTVKTHVLPRDLETNADYIFQPWEKELVKIIDKYSDEKLMRKFSRAGSVSEFYSGLKATYFQKQVLPYIEKMMFRIVEILMVSPVRLINKESKYANVYDEDEIKIPPFFAHPVFTFKRTENATKYSLKIFHNKKELVLKSNGVKVITNEPCMLLYHSKLVVFEKLDAKKLLPFFEKDFIEIPQSMEEKYYSGFVLNTVRDFDVQADGFSIVNDEADKQALLSLEPNLKNEPGFVLRFEYGNERFIPGSKSKIAVSFEKQGEDFVFRKTFRDTTWENEVLETIHSLHLKEDNGYYYPKGAPLFNEEQLLYFMINWISDNKPILESKKIRVIQEKLEKNYFTGKQTLELKTTEKGDWFDVYALVQFGEFKIPFIKLKKYILNDIREFELPNGEIAVLPEEWFARYRGLLPFASFKGDYFQFEKHHFSLLKHQLKGTSLSILDRLKELEFSVDEFIELPKTLKAELRNYQKEGYSWMFQLQKKGFGGCLADDMGLGKTLQTLTLLLKLKRKKSAIRISDPTQKSGQLNLFGKEEQVDEIQPASLIVLPTSLIHNWENEIRKFAPTLNVYSHVGLQRKKSVDLTKIAQFYDVILTTYGTVRNDVDLLKNTVFFYVILDESQYIKNPTSKIYQAVMKLHAKHRLVLTGTPIENSLSDLWAQMNFLNPGLLGNLAFFKRYFITPIEKHANAESQVKLQLMIRPFILRRKKEEVAKDLPPLMEQVRFCEMTVKQHQLYDEEKSIIRNTILESIEKEGVQKSSFVILQGLTKLRQLANHPRLMGKNDENSSGKMEEIFDMLENLIAENHKVLIFSSFVSHLKLLREIIERNSWKYSWLTGKTTNRKQVIQEFQNDAENRILLISLKAGGVGLNLTKADYVFIIDPWWNPASENQAISRAHRIGQDKHVFVYRFITENSIEEKIQQLQNRKSSLADKFINSNNPLKAATKEEIIAMFK